VRTCLSLYVPIAPSEWSFAKTAYGRPTISNASAAQYGLEFNVSHTEDIVAVTVARHVRLGIDLERCRGLTNCADLAASSFARQEVADISRLPPAQRERRFIEYWTLKEAYAKARGMGLSIPLNEVAFYFSARQELELLLADALHEVGVHWHFYQAAIDDQHIVAVCADNPRTLDARRIIPLVEEQPMPLQFLRCTTQSNPNCASTS
jgi:4'-phosphopantetheinyl transferase